MNNAFDQTLPMPSRWDQDGAEYVRSTLDWCARCSKRMVGLAPDLSAEEALNVANDLCFNDNLRAMSPERVAEDLHRAQILEGD